MKVHCLIFDGFSDWEIAYALPELRNKSVEILTVGFSDQHVTSMGGLKVKPSCNIMNLKDDEIKTFVIPGGRLWEEDYPVEFLDLIKKLRSSNTLIAAICGGTIPLAQAGFLDTSKHTSNSLDYLRKMAPQYKGYKSYSSDLATSEENLITASGIGSIEFAKELFLTLKTHDQKSIESWFNLFKHGKWSG